ncbi:MAG: OmpH family outer membrane protein [Caulobacterales bacterium]
MTSRHLLTAGAVVAVLAAMATSAYAQATRSAAAPAASAAAAPPPPPTSGPPVPGVCLFSEPAVVVQSTVGQAMKTRLEQLLNQVKAELQPQGDSIQSDERALEAARPTLDSATLQKRAADLNLRYTSFQKLEQQRTQELQVTERKARARIDSEIEPVLRQVYQQRNCSLLLDAQVVLAANPAMDLTPAVTTGLNARIQSFAFEREHIDEQAAAPPQ